jgi:hypothetical protein
MLHIRRLHFIKECVLTDSFGASGGIVTRAAGLAVIRNPFAGLDEHDLGLLADFGEQLGIRLSGQIAAMLPGPAIAYGKAALVGTHGDIEHAAALLHPKLGKPMRNAIGGGAAIIPSTSKVVHAGAAIDIPLGHKDDVWSFDEIDTMTLMVADAPRPDEIVLAVAFADGGRPRPRIGKPG